MAPALTTDQIKQIINNTMLVMLVRPDLKPEWHTNLEGLIQQAQDAAMDDEALFAAAVLALIYSPGDTLPTGTAYDTAWQALLVSLQSGVAQTDDAESEASMTLDRLLKSVAEAVITVQRNAPSQKTALLNELDEVRQAGETAGVSELIRWLDDVTALVNGAPITTLGQGHQGVFRDFWDMIVRGLET